MMQAYAAPPVPGLPPSPIYRVPPSIGVPVSLTGNKPVQPLMESQLVRFFPQPFTLSISMKSNLFMVILFGSCQICLD